MEGASGHEDLINTQVHSFMDNRSADAKEVVKRDKLDDTVGRDMRNNMKKPTRALVCKICLQTNTPC